MLLNKGCYPYAVSYNGHYYFTMQCTTGDSISIWETGEIEKLAEAKRRVVWTSADDYGTHFWSPELHRLNDRWYLYFEADDGNTDNHQLYVMECQTDDPMTGEFVMKGTLQTNDEWNYGIHPASST